MNIDSEQILLQEGKDEVVSNMPLSFQKMHDGVVTEITTNPPHEGLIIPWLIGGLPGSGKTILTSQEIERLYSDPRIINWEKRSGRRIKIYYMSLGRTFDLIDQTLFERFRSAHGTSQLYRDLSEHAGQVQTFALDHLPGPGVLFSDFVYLTAIPGRGDRKRGIERGSLRYARRFVQSRRGRVTLIIADETQRDDAFNVRENILSVEESEAKEVSEKAGIAYDFKDGKVIKYLHQRSSNQIMRERNDREVMWLGYDLIVKNQFHDSDLDLIPIGSFRDFRKYFRTHPQEWTHFLVKHYSTFWLESLFQQEDSELGISVLNVPLEPGTIRHVREKNLLKTDVVDALRKYAQHQRSEKIRSAVANLGIAIL